jgi:hypothetical protein
MYYETSRKLLQPDDGRTATVIVGVGIGIGTGGKDGGKPVLDIQAELGGDLRQVDTERPPHLTQGAAERPACPVAMFRLNGHPQGISGIRGSVAPSITVSALSRDT